MRRVQDRRTATQSALVSTAAWPDRRRFVSITAAALVESESGHRSPYQLLADGKRKQLVRDTMDQDVVIRQVDGSVKVMDQCVHVRRSHINLEGAANRHGRSIRHSGSRSANDTPTILLKSPQFTGVDVDPNDLRPLSEKWRDGLEGSLSVRRDPTAPPRGEIGIQLVAFDYGEEPPCRRFGHGLAAMGTAHSTPLDVLDGDQPGPPDTLTPELDT